jgi:hypothetical protein
MNKKRLEAMLQKFSSSIGPEEGNVNPLSTMKQALVTKYRGLVHQSFVRVLSTEPNDNPRCVDFDVIGRTLAELWQLVQGSMLTYTARPEDTSTLFLVQVAYEALAQHLSSGSPSLVAVIKLLMPTLQLEEDDLLVPENFGCQLSNAAITKPGFKKNQTKKQKITTVIDFLKTHFLADNNRYLIPLWALNRLSDNSEESIPNFYYQNSDDPTKLTPSECTRLSEHNPLTQSVNETVQRLNGYYQDKSSLLGQLYLLSKSLFFNSIHGIGTEYLSGTTAELSIRRFFDYYNTLDPNEVAPVLTPELEQQLMKLRHCIAQYRPGEPTIEEIDTCMATRREQLLQAINGHEGQLAKITSSEANISHLIERDQRLLKQQLITLNQAVENNAIAGYERLPINKQLIDHLEIDCTVQNFESLADLTLELSSTELPTIITPADVANWSEQIASLENLVLLLLTGESQVLCVNVL